MKSIGKEFQTNRIMRRAAAGVLSAFMAAASLLGGAQIVPAAENDGLIYGTAVDNSYQSTSGSSSKSTSSSGSSSSDNTSSGISISGGSSSSENTSPSSGNTTSEITGAQLYGDSASISIDYTNDESSVDSSDSMIDFGSSQTTVSSDGLILGSTSSSGLSSAASASAGSSGSSSSGSSNTSWLIYGGVASDIFGGGTSAGGSLSIEGGSSSVYTFSSFMGTDASFNEAYTALEIYVYLRNQGFSSASACGVLGNIMRESSMDPTAYNVGGDSYGLFQCTGSLKTRQENYCTSHGLSVSDAMAQTQSMILDTAPYLFTIYGKNCDNITYAQFKQLTDPQYAAEAWRAVVERNNYSAADTKARKDFAQSYYNKWASYDGSGFDIIEEALKYVGNPYVWGGDSLTMGIDCSHFVCKILTLTGHYSGSYRTSLNLRTVGTEVTSLSQAQPGDILCWQGHVALYITDGYYVNAANSNDGICVGGGDIATKLGGLITIRRVR